MNDMKQSLVQMFDLLSREEKILLGQVAEEGDTIERFRITMDLQNVRAILSELTSKLADAAHQPPKLHLFQI